LQSILTPDVEMARLSISHARRSVTDCGALKALHFAGN